jgi:hypothetical protein
MSRSKSICYHTRLVKDGTKVVGGSFGGAIDQETVERITRLFSVVVKPSGTPVFIDDDGREVNLYFHINPKDTVKGSEAIKAHQLKKEQEWEEEQKQIREREEVLQQLMSSLTYEEILERLKN